MLYMCVCIFEVIFKEQFIVRILMMVNILTYLLIYLFTYFNLNSAWVSYNLSAYFQNAFLKGFQGAAAVAPSLQFRY